MARNIGATLSLKDGNFFTNIKSAISATGNLKNGVNGATNTLKTHSKQLNSVGSTLKSAAGRVIGFVAAYASVRQIVSFTNDCIAAANAQTAAEKRLQQTMSNVAGTTQLQIDSIKAYSAALQGVTSVGDEVTIHGASQLATFQLQSDTIKTLLPSLQDLAVSQYGVNVSSEQMQSMANLVGKVMTGSVSALTRYGVTMNDTQKKILQSGSESQRAAMLVDVLKQNFGGLAEAMANTPEGRVQQLKNAWGDMQEVIGAKLYPVITKTLTWAAAKIPTVQNVLSKAVNACEPIFNVFTDNVLPAVDRLMDSFKGVGESITNAFSETNTGGLSALVSDVVPGLIDVFASAVDGISWMIDNWELISPVVAGVVGAIATYKAAVMGCNAISVVGNVVKGVGAAFTFLSSPVGLVVTAIGAAIAVGVAMYKNWDKLKEKFPQFTTTVEAGIAVVKPILVGLGNTILSSFKVIWISISTIFKNAVAVVKGVVSVFGTIINTACTVIGGNIKNVFANVSVVISGVVGVISNVVSLAVNIFTGNWSGAWENVKNIGSIAIGTVKTVIINSITTAKDTVSAVLTGIKTVFSTSFNTVKTVVSNTFNGIKSIITEKIDAAKTAVKSAIDGIKKLFDFDWKLPDLKMPHISITGDWSWNPPSVPTFGIDWYAKGGIMTRPTIFGVNGNKALGGGERGAEAILPLSALWDKLREFLKPQPALQPAVVNHNQITVKVYSNNEDDATLADKVANRIMEILDNM